MANITGAFLQQNFNPADWTYYGRTYIPLSGEGASWSDPVYKNNKTGETMTPAQYAASGAAPQVTDYNSLVKYAQWYEGQKGKTISPDKLNEFSLLSPDVQAAMIANPELAVKSMEATANLANGDWLSLGAEGGLNSASAWKWGPNGLYYDNSAYNQINGNGWDERFASFVDDNATNIGLALMGGSMAAGLSGAGGTAGSGAAADGVTVGSAAGGNAAGAGITSSELGAGGAATGASATSAGAGGGAGGGFSAGNLGTAATVANTLNSADGQSGNTSTSSGSFVDPTTGLTYNSNGTGAGTLANAGTNTGLLNALAQWINSSTGSNLSGSALGALLGGVAGYAGSDVTPATSSKTPWTESIPYLQQAMQAVSGQLGGTSAYTTPEQAVAALSPTQVAANAAGLNIANTQLAPMAQQIAAALMPYATGQMLDINSNPTAQAAIKAAIDPVTQALMETVLPGISNTSIGNGALGGSRQGVAQGLAIDKYAKDALNASSTLANQLYAQNIAQMNSANTNLQGLNDWLMSPYTVGQTVGTQERSYDQALKDALSTIWNQQQASQKQAATTLATIGGQGSAETKQDSTSNPWLSALGGALTGSQATTL